MQNVRKYLQIAGQVVGLAIFGYQLSVASGQIPLLNRHIDFSFVLWAIIISFIGMGFQIYAWRIIMNGLGYSLSLSFVVSGYTLSLLPRYIPGSIWGYFSRNEWLLHNKGIDYKSSNLSSIIEISCVLLSAIMICGLSVIAISSQEKWLALAIVVSFIGVSSQASMKWFDNHHSRISPLFIHNRITGHTIRAVMRAVIFMLFAWSCFGLGLFVTFQSINLPISGIDAWDAIFVFSVAWTAGFLVPFLPSGMGAREWVMTLVVSYVSPVLGGYALVISVVNRITLFLSELVWLFLGLFARGKHVYFM